MGFDFSLYYGVVDQPPSVQAEKKTVLTTRDKITRNRMGIGKRNNNNH
jgi:hypothetical protein